MENKFINLTLEDWYKKFECKNISREKLRKYYLDFIDKKLKIGHIITEMVKRDYERCKRANC